MRDHSNMEPTSGSATILVAEDHFDSREALSGLLEAFGFRVLTAVNGREAVDVAIRYVPDLILMDIMMPELDGFEATRLLRETATTRHIPIIVLTAMEGARQIALQAGANEFVPKPIESRTLLNKIRGFIPSD